jgi:hypothetical protein
MKIKNRIDRIMEELEALQKAVHSSALKETNLAKKVAVFRAEKAIRKAQHTLRLSLFDIEDCN